MLKMTLCKQEKSHAICFNNWYTENIVKNLYELSYSHNTDNTTEFNLEENASIGYRHAYNHNLVNLECQIAGMS